jgi:hypothetical protein
MTKKADRQDAEPPAESVDLPKDRHWRVPHGLYQPLRDYAADEGINETDAVMRLLTEGLMHRGYLLRWWKRPRQPRQGKRKARS